MNGTLNRQFAAKPISAGLYTEEKDAFNFETTAVKQGDRYILNGHKTASTGGLSCTSWIVYAALLPHAWGLTDINACLDYNRLTVLFGVIGGARRCLDIALEYAGTRYQFGAPIASKQLIQTMLADMAERVAMGELASLHLARRWQAGTLPRFDVSLIKRHNCATALEVARMARTILGANGVDLDRHVIRHLLNMEASYSYGGTHEIHGLIVGKELTRESAF